MGKVVNPIKRKNGGRMTAPTPNQEPCTARGIRRSNKTEEYQQNLAERKNQVPGNRSRGTGGKRGIPFKGPSKRPSSVSTERWKAYMEGRSSQL